MKLKFKKSALSDQRRRGGGRLLRRPAADRPALTLPHRPRPQGAGQALPSRRGFKNADVRLTDVQILENIQTSSGGRTCPSVVGRAECAASARSAPVNLDVEMETGTGKTYCYIKTMFELNKRYGWSKFIVVVPSIAIREGVHKSLRDHRRPLPGKLRQEGAVLHLQFQAAARAGELFVRRRHQRDDHQRAGVQCHGARTPGASTRSWTTSSRAGPST